MILVVVGHPNPGSFNHAIARAAVETLEKAGKEVVFHDLCAEGFDPALPAAEIPRGADLDAAVARHCRELAACEGLVVVHPNWWGMPPAVLAGWVDRVFRPDTAYRFLEGDGGEGVPEGLLKARTALVFNTANTPDERERTVFGDPLDLIWKRCVFGLCGVEDVRRRTFSVVVAGTPEQRSAWLGEVRGMVAEAFIFKENGA